VYDEAEWEHWRRRLADAGVAGVEDLGRFVSNPAFFGGSAFDERAAMPVLIEGLREVTDPGLAIALAGHLRRPWARPAAYDALHAAFLDWTPRDPRVGWALGDALGSAATAGNVDDLVAIAEDRDLGMARQMVVDALGRVGRGDERVASLLVRLTDDPDTPLHALSALRRVAGPAAALPHYESFLQRHSSWPQASWVRSRVKAMHKSLDR
jgi:hypothetical protein